MARNRNWGRRRPGPHSTLRFNKSHPLAQKCFWAVLPFTYNHENAEHFGMWDIGDNGRLQWNSENNGTGSVEVNGSSNTFVSGLVFSGTITGSTGQRWVPAGVSTINLPFRNLQRWTVLSIVHWGTQTDTTLGVNFDNRLISKDVGTAEIDHTFMIGVQRGIDTETRRARCRIGFGGNRTEAGETILVANDVNTNFAAQDLCLVAVTYDGVTLTLFGLRLRDGVRTSVSASDTRSGDVTLNTDEICIGANAGATTNFFEGGFHICAGFDLVMNEAQLWDYFSAPYAIFERPSSLAVKASAVAPTSVTPPVGSEILTGIAPFMDFGVIPDTMIKEE